jgi:iron complex outermembrane recepter protein
MTLSRVESAITAQVGGGNPSLLPEEADTISVGLGYRPGWAPGFVVTVDYYDIEITNAINTVNGQAIVDICHSSGYTDPLCDLVTRPFPPTNTTPANFPTAIASLTPINIGFMQTKGFDIEASLTFDPGIIPGTITLSGSATHVSSFEVNNGTGAPTFKFEGFYGEGLLTKQPGGLPEWRANLRLTYENGPLTVFAQERFIDSLSRIGGARPDAVFADDSHHISSVFYTDLTVEYMFPSYDVAFFGTVNNVFDRNPPLIAPQSFPNLAYPAGGSVHDLIGRSFTLGVRMGF